MVLAYLINIYEFQGFKFVKHFLTYILVIGIQATLFSQGKTENNAALPANFPDSVRIALEKTRNIDPIVTGGGFFSAWSSLNLAQQNTIQKQVGQMKRMKYGLKPYLINYFGAISNAINIEKIDASRFTDFLSVTQQVLDAGDSKVTATFFNQSREFFQYHALHYEKSFRLYVTDDNYQFEYIAPAPTLNWEDSAPNNDPPKDDNWQDTQPANDPVYDDTPPAPYDDTIQESMPSWLTPPVQPYVEGPVIRFDRLTLNFVTKYDSVFLKNTKGVFSLKDNLFVGEGGSFDWTSAGLNNDVVTCTFTAYNFNTNNPDVKADLVKLNYTGKTPGEIAGTFEFKSQARKDSVASTYPQFKSYQSDIAIQGIGNDNIKYKGGFSLTGNKISSGSLSGDYSMIDVSSEGERKFTAWSPEFLFLDSAIQSARTKIKIYQRNDSIVHPDVKIRYDFNKENLSVIPVKGSLRNAPYAASFFNIDFSADILKWDLKSDSMNIFTNGNRNTVPMVIESVDFYDQDDFRLLGGQGFSFHPLVLAVSYCLKNKTRQFYSGDLSNFAKKDIQEIKHAMEFLSQKGYATYNPRTDLVIVKNKAVELYRSFKGESDYDNLKIHSVIDSSANATLNFDKGYMTVRGVEEFKVSDSLNVRIEPDSSVITIMQNRDIKFDGTISAGNFEISGKGFMLKYDSFFISMSQIDSINFYVSEKNSKGQNIRRKVNNSMVGADSTAAAAGDLGDISKSSGTLYISKTNNKSGKAKLPNYPRLDASTGGVIYFDRPEVLSGAYDRSFFFVIPPFKIDSLNDADPASINFDGTFVSSGMFPKFKEKLHTMPDKSLGFEHAIPKEGYQLFNGDGNMTGALSLNNRGLRGYGKINYLAATVSSPDFLFYPDSVIANGSRAKIDKKQFGDVLFPQASLPDFEMKWYPKQDQMVLKNTKAPFNFYDSTAQLNGKIIVSKAGVAGEGKLDTRGTELLSKEISFTGNSYGARHAKFKVNSNDPQKPLMFGNDIRLKFNLEQNYADISPEVEGTAAINFPYAQVKTSIPNARWDLNTQKIIMTKNPEASIESSYFYSTRKELDSLYFNAESAEYDMKTQELKVSGIPYIIVADAKITPENNEVLILENSKIGTLKNTTIIVDTLNGYHRLTQGVVDIISRREFTGYATYQYVNFLSDTFAIKMTDFHLEPVVVADPTRRTQRKTSNASMQTVATGAVTEKDKLVLGAGMFYKGNMIMYATRPALQLDGYVKLDIKKIKNYNTWIKYNQTGDETDVSIDFANAVNEDGKRVEAGLHFAQDNSLYISFLNEKRSEGDEDLFLPDGSLFYDPESKEYKIEDREKSAGNKLSGKVFSYNDDNLQVRFEGPISLFNGSKDFSVTATALGSGNLETSDIRMNTLLVMDSNVPAQAFDIMARDIKEVIKIEGAEEGLGDQTELLYKIADIVGERVVKEYEQKTLQGYVSLSTLAALAKPLVLSNVNLKWSDKRKAFYSEGTIGISNILRNDINGAFEGFVEVKKTEDGGSIFNVFIKASPDSWYYFGFEGSRLLVHSSNSEFNSTIAKKTNAGKAKIGEIAFIPGSDDETLAFINRFRNDYYGIETPYSLSGGTRAPKKTTEEQPTEEKKKTDDGF